MKGSASLLVTVVAATACSSTGGAPASPLGPVSWPIGEYALEARFEFKNDTALAWNMDRADYFAVLLIAPDGSLTFQSANGICRDPTWSEVDRDEALRRKTFRCGDFTFVVEPAGSTIRGELTATVTERTRQRGECVAFSAVGCGRYQWTVNSDRTQKRVRLTVIPRS
jgi:hypothetical protein